MNEFKIKQAIRAFQDTHFFSDLELLQLLKMLAGYKRSVRMIFSGEERMDKVLSVLKKFCICFRVNKSAGLSGTKDRNKGGWTNLCSSIEGAEEYAIYISLNTINAQKALEAESGQDDGQFGEELSYPDCCNDFFAANFPEASEIQGDLFPFVFQNTPEHYGILPYLLNPLWYFDAGYIEYWPCSFRCANALAEARIGEKLLKQYLPKIALQMKTKLCAPVLYTEYSGIFSFQGSHYDPKTQVLKYSPQKMLATAKTPLYHKLQAGNQLHRQDDVLHIFRNGKEIHKIVNAFATLACFAELPHVGDNVMFETVKKFHALGLSVPGTTEVELMMFLSGKKKALRLIVCPEEYSSAIALALLLKCEYYVSDKRVAVVSTPGTGDEYINYVANAPKDAKYLICYAKKLADAKSCAELETMTSDDSKVLLNHLLNYPTCCVDSFLHRTNHDDWIKPFLERTPIENWYPVWTNRLGYLFTGTMPLYDYEPCSAFCTESLELGKALKETYLQNNMEFALRKIINQCSTPIFLHDGILVLMQNAVVKRNEDQTEITYNSGEFQLKDYNLKPEVEHSRFWNSNRMVVQGTRIVLYDGNVQLKTLRQTEFNNRIFLFEE